MKITKEEIKEYMKSQRLKFWVLKINDFVDALTEEELMVFNMMLQKHSEYRISLGKSPGNRYWVVNRDDTPIQTLEEFLKVVGAEHCLKENEKH